MSLLLDHNISPKLSSLLGSTFGKIIHVDNLQMGEQSDREIWNYAKETGFHIVTKDKDFFQLSALLGAPPKVIFLKTGNCSTEDIVDLFQQTKGHIQSFLDHPKKAHLILPLHH